MQRNFTSWGPDRTFSVNFHGRCINFSRNLQNMTLINSKAIVLYEKHRFWCKHACKKKRMRFFRRISPLRRDPVRAPPLRGARAGPIWGHMNPYGPISAHMGSIWAHIGPYWARMGPHGPIWAQVMRELGQQQYGPGPGPQSYFFVDLYKCWARTG